MSAGNRKGLGSPTRGGCRIDTGQIATIVSMQKFYGSEIQSAVNSSVQTRFFDARVLLVIGLCHISGRSIH
jgi:hypothetical protein